MNITIKGHESCICKGQPRRITITDKTISLIECTWQDRIDIKHSIERDPEKPITIEYGRSNDDKPYTLITIFGEGITTDRDPALLRIQYWDHNPDELFCWMIGPGKYRRAETCSEIFRMDDNGHAQRRKIIALAEQQ